MLIKGHINSNKTEILINSYAELLNQGADAEKILVIVQNFKKKNEFIEKTKSLLKIDALTNLNVHTFFGLVYNSILNNWVIIENEIRVNIQRVAEGHLDLSRKLNECIKLSSDIKDRQEIQDIYINMHHSKLKAL